MLKTAHRGFPKSYLNTLSWTGEEHRGATKSVETTTSIGGREYKIYGHAWNEPGTADVPKKCLLSTWNHILPVDDHQKKHWRLNPDTGLSENITRSVPRTQMIKSYFEAACAIDIHNHLRQDGLALERTVGAHEWWFRCLCTILGFIEVDAFKAYCYFNKHANPPKHQDFIENLAIILLSNRYEGAHVEETEHVRVLRKRPLAARDDSFVEEEDFTVHHLVPIPEYLRQVQHKKAKTESHKKHGSSLRCRMCPKPAPPAAQLAAMPMVTNHLQCVVLSLGKTAELCMLSLCTIFVECTQCSNCSTSHLTYKYSPNSSIDLMNLICVT